jgi:hypothetical protein
MKFYLSKIEREVILGSLNAEQRHFLFEKLKRSKQTVFANTLAKNKANSSSPNNELLEQIQSWILVEYIDAGTISSDLKCECGRSLRYQYIVENQKTKEILKFGINHLQEHTGIPPDIAREIIKGISEIDYELDELLFKIQDSWSFTASGLELPVDFTIPPDILEHLNLRLPLLDKQIKRLYLLVQEIKKKEQERQWVESRIEKEGRDLQRIRVNFELQKMNDSHRKEQEIQLMQAKKEREERESQKIKNNIAQLKPYIKSLEFPFDLLELNENQQQVIVAIVESSEGNISVREICEFLIKTRLSSNDRFSSGKPAIFPYVSMFLEFLKSKGKCTLIKGNTDDRIYKAIL